jgi:hypothetical protein
MADKPTYTCPNCGSHGTLPVCCSKPLSPNNANNGGRS